MGCWWIVTKRKEESRRCFFTLPKEEYGDHLSMVGWQPYDKVITDGRQYWMPPPADPMVESLENDDAEDMDE